MNPEQSYKFMIHFDIWRILRVLYCKRGEFVVLKNSNEYESRHQTTGSFYSSDLGYPLDNLTAKD